MRTHRMVHNRLSNPIHCQNPDELAEPIMGSHWSYRNRVTISVGLMSLLRRPFCAVNSTGIVWNHLTPPYLEGSSDVHQTLSHLEGAGGKGIYMHIYYLACSEQFKL